jgi:hypothetical protein
MVCAGSVCLAQAQVLEDCCSVVNPWAELALPAPPLAKGPLHRALQPKAPPLAPVALVASVASRASTPAWHEIELVPMIRPVPGFDSVPDAPAAPGIINPWSTAPRAARASRPEIVDPWSETKPRVPTAVFPPIE